MNLLRSILILLPFPILAVAAETLVSTGQMVRPAGESVAFAGRPVDVAVSPDGRTVFAKINSGLVVIDAATWQVRQELASKSGASLHGLAISRDGRTLYYTTVGGSLCIARIDKDGKAAWAKTVEFPGKSVPCGVALSADGKLACVALSRSNEVAIVDLTTDKIAARVPVGIAPFDVAVSPDGKTAYVSNWGGRRPREGEPMAKFVGSDLLVDKRGIPCSGTISRIDLSARAVTAETEVGLHPSTLALRRDGTRLYVANANSDTVSIVGTSAFRVVETVPVRPDPTLPFGSITCGLALSPDEQTLFAANGGNNAVAVIALGDKSEVKGFIPTGWFPSAVAVSGRQLFLANTKGDGPEMRNPAKPGWNSKQHRGTVSRVAMPDAPLLADYTAKVRRDAMVPQALRALEKSQGQAAPVPVPAHVGDPSVFEHVVFVLKENRTYDQVFGDLKQGNGDPNLCIYGRQVTPNHHALAEEFVLLDNYYCNGVLSADGHAWAMQGVATDYEEKTFGGWSRSYDFGTDPLAFAPNDFLWDSVLLHGLSFRNYGEFDFPKLDPAAAKWLDVFGGKAKFSTSLTLEPLRPYTAPDYPGWNLRIPDAVRLERFLAEFRQFEKKGQWPNFVLVYLPQDHTSGASATAPTPRAHVADNDLALGKLVEAISHSPFWGKTCIFVNEDDPQDGFDHVDGHRSLCLVISPYTKRKTVVSHFYNQTSVRHTMERILGLPPATQFDALAPTMEDCFTDRADPTPYTALPNNIPLNEMNGQHKAAVAMDFSRPDRINEDQFNRILWEAAKGPDVPYPALFAGAHGRGLKTLHLRLVKADDDD